MEKDRLDIDWGYIVDLLASEYGWTIEYIGNLNLSQIKCLCGAIKDRYDKKNGKGGELNPNGNSNSSNEELKLSDFENKMGGKKVIHEDGTVEIIV